MTIHWILESNVFSEKCFEEMVDHFTSNGILYDVVRVKPFVHEIEGKMPLVLQGEPVVVYGSLGVQKLCKREHWVPGVWSGENFSERYLVEKFGDLALNSDAQFCKMSEVLKLPNLPDPFFIKPNTDSKEFAGMLIAKDEFADWYQKMVAIGYFDTDILELAVIVAAPKKIGTEWRLVVVDGKVVGGSIYRQYQQVRPEEGYDDEVGRLAEYTANENRPADVYVVDICESEQGLKIIEFNTFNSAGLYKVSVGPVINAINDFLSTTEQPEPWLEAAYIEEVERQEDA